MEKSRCRQEEEIPRSLIDSVLAGDCVAFVGAGFSAAAGFPSWKSLLFELSQDPDVPGTSRRYLQQILEKGSAHAFDEAAQLLEDCLGREPFRIALEKKFRYSDQADSSMSRRLRLLHGIPFRSVLTTNFDSTLEGKVPGAGSYREHLRKQPDPWWSARFWDTGPTPILKLHGDLRHPHSVVLSRRSYRQLLYGQPNYQAFLRALFAQRTILFLGFSFTDAYLNELRSEALALLGDGKGDEAPIAYALVNDAPALMRKHYRETEGIHLISFDSRSGTDFSKFDDILESLHDSTNPIVRFARALDGKRILWVDAKPLNNYFERKFLKERGRLAHGTGPEIVLARTVEEAHSRLEQQLFDLVITHWGFQEGGAPVAVQVLEAIRRRGEAGAPVIVYSSGDDVIARRRRALALGAQDYLHDPSELLRATARVLGNPAEC